MAPARAVRAVSRIPSGMVSTAAAAPFAGGKRWPGVLVASVAARATRAPPARGTLPASAGERRQDQVAVISAPL